ncbi:MAG: sodium:proton antiporter, partial [Flavobacteriales bacterium]|nr:sodium:proton antiporter [Flavobacteriales bacterium]
MMDNQKVPYIIAFLPILILIILLSVNVIIFENAIGGPNQIALIFAGTIASIVGILYGCKWQKIIEGISNSIKSV